MKILVCVKPVPDPDQYGNLTIDPKSKRLIREGIPTIINPTDKNALEAALQLKERFGGSITVVSMAPPFCRDKMVESLAMGADEAVLLSDADFAGADTYVTSYVLAEAIRSQAPDFDLILAGNESADGATSHVPTQIAEWLGLSHVCNVTEIVADAPSADHLQVLRRTESADLLFDVELPAVIAVSREVNKPRLVNAMGIVKARKKPLNILSNEDLGLDPQQIGLAGSPTQPGELLQPDLARAGKSLGTEAEEAVDKIMDLIAKAGV